MTVKQLLRRRRLVAACLATALVFTAATLLSVRAQNGLALQVTQPDGFNDRVAAGRDYATEQLGDPWDMNEATDINLDESLYVSNATFANGIFSGTAANNDPNLFLLEPGLAGTQRHGRTGKYFPIDTSTYRVFTIRMYVSVASSFQVFWFTSDSFTSNFASSEFVATTPGWNTYTIDLSQTTITSGNVTSWTGQPATGLRLDPTAAPGSTFQIDWIRLTAYDDGSTTYPVTFSASDPGSNAVVKLYLDNDGTDANGTLGPIPTIPANLREDSDRSANLELARYAPGNYYVVGRVSRDYASLVLENAWDMSQSSDVSLTLGLSPPSYAGGVFTSTTTTNDPAIFLNVPSSGSNRIDASVYRSISFQLTLGSPSNVIIYWKTADGVVHNSPFLSPGAGNVYTYNLGADGGWYGLVSELRIDPAVAAGINVSLDWVSVNTGPGALASAPATVTSYSPGPLSINTPPIAHLLQPDAMGGLDYASYIRNNPWNMAEASDVELTTGLAPGYPQFLRDATVEGVRGDYMRGLNAPGNDDPAVFFLYNNTTSPIDANKFKNLTFRMSITGPRDVGAGSVARLFWQSAAAGSPIHTSSDIIIDAGLKTYVFDLTTVVGFAAPWAGTVKYFRIDPHEFPTQREFYFDKVRIAADDEANGKFAITWSASDPDDNATVSLYYDTDRTGFNGAPIATSLEDSGNNVHVWDTRGVPNGTYYVYAVIADGLNTTRRYATGRLVVNNGAPADTTAPIGSLETPGTITNASGRVNVQGWALDNVQIASVQVLVDGTPIGRPNVGIFRPDVRDAYPNYPETSEAGFQMSFDASGLGPGAHSLTVALYDTAGNRTLLGGAASGGDTAGVYIQSTGVWFLRNQNAGGAADSVFSFGPGNVNWSPIVGDWDSDGADGIGLFNGISSTFFLKSALSGGQADLSFSFGPGNVGWLPVAGDWNGDGVDTIGLYSPSTSAFFLKNGNSPGSADLTFGFGPAGSGWLPIAGDWNGDGVDTIGLYNAATGTFFLRNANTPGPADVAFSFGPANCVPLVGDWNNDGIDTIGVYVSSTGSWFLRNSNTSGNADVAFSYGPANAKPVAGDWNGSTPKW